VDPLSIDGEHPIIDLENGLRAGAPGDVFDIGPAPRRDTNPRYRRSFRFLYRLEPELEGFLFSLSFDHQVYGFSGKELHMMEEDVH
jgi:hypothetical protein